MVSPLNVIDVSRVTPSDSSESFTLSLTFFDLLWYKLHPVQRVIFYPLADATRPFFETVIVPNLKSSLSSSLSHYLPLAGKLVWDSLDKKPSLVYSPNDAVSFTVAESNAEFSLLTGNKPFPTTELYPLVPELQVSDESASAVSFQVTLFPNQGFCIGITAHHAVLDGKTTTMFLKFWANTCKRQKNPTVNASLPQDLIPNYNRTVIKAPGDIETKIMDQWNSFLKMVSGGKEPDNPKSLKILPPQELSPDVVRFTLDLTREDIQTLRERLKREESSASSSSPKELRLSTFVVTYSYVLTCVIRARGGDPNRPVGYAFAVDCRSLLDPPVPSNYFGNCVSAAFRVPLTAETFMGEEGFLSAARMVSDSVEGLDETVAFKLPEILAAFATVPPGAQLLSVAGSTRFGVYGLDFGWGKPQRVVVVSIDQGEAISMAEGRDGNGGVEIGFSLKKHEMDTLIDLLHDGLKS
ncbi:Phenolic glucoside malonyltransferase 1 [Raphanus sativus]|uniref:Phenolic glucoside malonyltransferase 1 n=1 Tax=Raphanus sativus TaxID=3726 RepID=A0A6J0N708_RAPSA|nr:phenolic glucoside malonyltransferase 1 [Raphanus sativus]KAJ4902369.1 Phenolic glucoside malonyltransferase 1 [Raphanus sativus]